MTGKQHPWLDGRLPAVDSLSEIVRIWTFLAGHTAKGDLDAVARDWSHLPAVGHDGGLEIILQTHLFAGYPRTINALATVRGLGVAGGAILGERAAETWIEDGEALCRSIYGDVYEPLRRRIAELHPALDRWMVEIGYGRVLSRAGPTPRERELSVLAVLAGQNVPRQMRSHLQGAVHVGATLDECGAVLRQTAAVWGEAAQNQVDACWASFVETSQ